ncbi:Gp49 family protein [Candidatus Contendibacter odensensis]|uniref:Uncharacterized protein n=1 Tax=Candidatus Contendobacter odensis Run_B_J11 TaxID=1400861 RepID=A0A7U7J580_9GAMM|nr:Gp49 family protein [Candidatus Contendobacter odensis]CDH46955.1 conserved hypothetical protein [Candidatus Contendobacter odensis Run_B_J11]
MNGADPEITPEQINATIRAVQFYQFPGTTLTVCALTLCNGFHVVGGSACVSPDDFDVELGQQRALENARGAIWDLEGYLLCERQYRDRIGIPDERR